MTSGYDEIQHLGGLSHVRHRPGMYVGSVSDNEYTSALMNMFREVVGNAADEFAGGHSTKIWVRLEPSKNRISVSDNGRGIPFGMTTIENPFVKGQKVKIDKLELATGVPNTGAKYTKGEEEAFRFSQGINGIGLKAVNALSSFFSARTAREDGHREIRYTQGRVIQPVTELDLPNLYGTTITWVPDPTILPFQFTIAHIKRYLHETAYLNAGLRIELLWGDGNSEDCDLKEYYEPKGIQSFLKAQLGKTSTILIFPLLRGAQDNKPAFTYEIALAVTEGGGESIQPFVNGGAIEGVSTPVVALRQVFARTMSSYVKDHYTLPKKYAKLTITPEHFRAGLFAVIKIKHEDPQFDSQTKTKLTNTDVSQFIQQSLGDQLLATLLKEDEAAEKIVVQAIRQAQAAEEAAKARAKVLSNKDSDIDLNVSRQIYTPPLTRDPSKNVLYLFEGLSAAGSLVNAAKARNPHTGDLYKKHIGILSLKGMSLNTKDIPITVAMKNVEFATLVKVSGLNPDNPDDLFKSEFRDWFITTDSDAGGDHITSLLVTFFLTHFPEVIRQGRLHRVITPLFELLDLKTKKPHFIYSNVDLGKEIASLGFKPEDVNKRFLLKRNKGLGELSELGKMTLVQDVHLFTYTVKDAETFARMRSLYDIFSGKNTISQRRSLIFELGLSSDEIEEEIAVA